MCVKTLTAEQEEFVWRFLCHSMQSDDEDPNRVIKESYGGDRSRYLKSMAGWHNIIFCDVCGKANKPDSSVFLTNMEDTGVNLCYKCAIEYRTQWRLDNFSLYPNIGKFVAEKRSVG